MQFQAPIAAQLARQATTNAAMHSARLARLHMRQIQALLRGESEGGAEADGEAESTPGAQACGGCGWFDSSYELSAGLEVTEGKSPSFAD